MGPFVHNNLESSGCFSFFAQHFWKPSLSKDMSELLVACSVFAGVRHLIVLLLAFSNPFLFPVVPGLILQWILL